MEMDYPTLPRSPLHVLFPLECFSTTTTPPPEFPAIEFLWFFFLVLLLAGFFHGGWEGVRVRQVSYVGSAVKPHGVRQAEGIQGHAGAPHHTLPPSRLKHG